VSMNVIAIVILSMLASVNVERQACLLLARGWPGQFCEAQSHRLSCLSVSVSVSGRRVCGLAKPQMLQVLVLLCLAVLVISVVGSCRRWCASEKPEEANVERTTVIKCIKGDERKAFGAALLGE